MTCGGANGSWFKEVRTPDLPELHENTDPSRALGAGCLVRDPGETGSSGLEPATKRRPSTSVHRLLDHQGTRKSSA